MNELKANLQKYGHPDVVLRVDARWAGLADGLPSYFEEEVCRGIRFECEQTIQLGSSLLKLEATSDGNLSAFEPDFESMPVNWVEGINRTVQLLAAQRAVCEECQVDPVFPSIQQAAFLPEVTMSADRFKMARLDPEGNHSGWTIHGGVDAAMRLISLYEAAMFNSAFVAFLALPAGSVVELEGKILSVSIGGDDYSSLSSDLLARIATHSLFKA